MQLSLEKNILKPRPRGSKPNSSHIFNAPRYQRSDSKVKKRPFSEKDIVAYHKEDSFVDRNWYQREDNLLDDAPSSQLFIGDQNEFANFQDDVEKINRARRMGTVYNRRKSHKARTIEKDQTKWEQNRIEFAGTGGFDRVDLDMDNEEEINAHVLAIDSKPHFLEGKDVDTSNQKTVCITKNPNSDLVILAKKGSLLLHELRKKKEIEASQKKAIFKDSGARFGPQKFNDKPQESSTNSVKKEIGDDVDYKSSSTYKRFRSQENGGATAFSRQKSIRQQREYLPIFYCRSELMRIIQDNQVVIVVGETGSGKTTQLTQYLLEEGMASHGMIACTQPRRVAAMSVAKRVANERNCTLGREVGYAIRFEDCTSKETRIKYLTDGVLLRESLRSKDLDEYSIVVMDEAHERSLHTDILFGLLKELCCRRRDLKLIVTSATLDAERFSTFFGKAPIFKVSGRTFPVDIIFNKGVCEDYLDSVVKQILSIHLTQGEGDILVFMTGQEDIDATVQVTTERLDKLGCPKPLLMLPIYSALPSDLQAKVFEQAPMGTRKCVVATNIAETSITLDGIKFVVDAGYCKLKVYNPRVGMDSLQITPISRANANQRSGRAGRTDKGFAYRMYTLLAYNSEMLENNVPEIQRTNLGNVVLLLKSLGVKDLLQFEFMDPPPEENILNSMYQLWMLGALKDSGELTELGRYMAEFPLDPPLSKMLVFSNRLGCSKEMLTIVSILSVPSIFYRPADRAAESDAIREKFTVPESDHLTYMRVYDSWALKNYSERWCIEHFVHYKAMLRVREVRSQLSDLMKQQNLPIESCEFDYDVVRKCVCAGYFHHAAKMKGIGEYANLRLRTPCFLHPSSGLYGLGYTPEYVVYHELVLTSREFMRTVTAVNPKWLAELAPLFFTLRQSQNERKASKRNSIIFRQGEILNKQN